MDFNSVRRSNDKYGFGEMEIGDVRFVRDPKADRVRAASSWYGKRHGMVFSCKRTVGGIYVSRIS